MPLCQLQTQKKNNKKKEYNFALIIEFIFIHIMYQYIIYLSIYLSVG